MSRLTGPDLHDTDDLAPARGCVNGLILGMMFWFIVGAMVGLWLLK